MRFIKNMPEQYLKKMKKLALQITMSQKIIIFFVLLTFVAVGVYFYNPQKKLLERRNSQRRSDVVNILNAAYQYGNENPDKFSSLIPDKPTLICQSKSLSCNGLVDLSAVIDSEKKLLSKIPIDPKENGKDSSGYQIWRAANGRLSVSAPLAESGAVITLSK